MAVIAYLRVSTDKQTVENQENEISKFALNNNMFIDKWYRETVSGTCKKEKRNLNKILSRMKSGDSLIVSEMSRLSRTIFESIEIMGMCISRGLNLFCVKENYSCVNNLASKIIGIITSLFSEMERALISQRTIEALTLRKNQGVRLGRPVGKSKIMARLMGQKDKIMEMLKSGSTKTEVAEKMNISRVTLYKFITLTNA